MNRLNEINNKGITHQRHTCWIWEGLAKLSAYCSKKKTIQEYLRLLKLTKTEYQKLFEENKILKEKINTVESKRQIKKEKIIKKRQYKVDTDSKEEQEEEEEERDMQEEKERLELKKNNKQKS